MSKMPITSAELMEAYSATKKPGSARKLTFTGVEGYDVYNISHAFCDGGKEYIAGRVEKRDDELSFVRIFEKEGEYSYKAVFPDMVFEKFQDPFVTRINGELVLGGVQIETDPLLHKRIINWRTLFYRGDSLENLALFAVGPNKMKDIRLGQLPDGKVAVFTRPQGGFAGPGRIGYITVDSLDMLSEERIAEAKVYDTHFMPDEWGGANQVIPLSDGTLGVIGHIACRDTANYLHYRSMSFVFDPIQLTHTPVQIIAERQDLPEGPSKRPDLADVLFTGGIVVKEDGCCDLYTGVSDCEAAVVEIQNPFA